MRISKYKIFILIFFVSVSYCDSQWVKLNGPNQPYVYSILIFGSSLLAGTMQDGLYISTDEGFTWQQIAFTPHFQVPALVSNNTTIFASVMNAAPESLNGVYLSTDNGFTWTQTLFNHLIVTLSIDGTTIYAGEYNNGAVYISTDNGNSWEQKFIMPYYSVLSILLDSTKIFAGTENGVYVSTNQGQNWSQTALGGQTIKCMAKNGDNLFAGTIWGTGIYCSTNRGISWNLTSMHNRDVDAMISYGSYIIAATLNDIESLTGIYMSSNNGISWIKKNEGYYENYTMFSFYISNNILYGGLDRVWKRSLSELIGVEKIQAKVTDKFQLNQNYPNPFNPTTKIKFDIISGINGQKSAIKLVIYDVLGREIAMLVNEKMSSGSYEATWDGTNYPSGVYFYKLTAGTFEQTKKMVLIK